MANAETAPEIPQASLGDIPDDSNVELLLQKHKEEIAELRSLCPQVTEQEVYPYYDQIFFLRYILSFKTVPKARAAVEKKIAWDKENAELVNAALSGEFNIFNTDPSPDSKYSHILREVVKYQVAGLWNSEGLKDRGFLVIVRGGLGKPKLLATSLTRDENVSMQMTYRIAAYKHCDEMTRKTGRLAKQTLMMDVSGMTFNDLVDPKQQKIYGAVSKASTYLFPQLIRKMCIVNAPKWMSIVVKIASAFLPKSTMEKIGLFKSYVRISFQF